MAKEHKRIELPRHTHGILPDELVKLLDAGWYLKRWTENELTDTCTFYLEREVPDHE